MRDVFSFICFIKEDIFTSSYYSADYRSQLTLLLCSFGKIMVDKFCRHACTSEIMALFWL